MLSDEEELEKIKKLERADSKRSALLHAGIMEWDDDEKLKFHKYVKGIAQKLLGDSINLDDEDLVFLLSRKRDSNAASATLYTGERFIFFSKGLLDICENEDQFAFILAHELQHWLERKNLPVDFKPSTKAEEAKCDILAIKKMMTAGYDIEEGYKIAAKLFKNGCYSIFYVLDEHPLSDERIKYIGVKVLEVRESLIKSGKYQKKTPVKLYNPDISLWEFDALEKFFKQDKYVQADDMQKVKFWFEQFDKLSEGHNGLQKISEKDLKTLKNEYFKLVTKIRESKNLCRFYEEMYCQRVLAIQTLSELDVFKDNWYLHLDNPHFRNSSTKQKKSVTDYFKPFRESVGKETKLYCAKLELLREAFFDRTYYLFDLSNKPERNIGVKFSQDVIEARSNKNSPLSRFIGVIKDENNGVMIYVSNKMYLLDKDYTIQKYLGSKKELERIKEAKEYNDYFELYNQLQAGELPLNQDNVKEMLDKRKLISNMTKEKFRFLKKYLSSEALSYLTAHFKKKPLWDGKVCDILCQYMKKEDKTPQDAAGYEEFMKYKVFGLFCDEWSFLEQKKIIDIYFLTGGTRFPRFACTVTTEMLAQHLKAGKDLDDFKFPYDKYFYAFNEKFLADLALKDENVPYSENSPFLVENISEYACLELLKKNPKIDLSQVCEIKYSGGRCDSYLSAYFPFELMKENNLIAEWEVDNVLYNRLYDNITNLDNWGDGSSAISDLPYYKRVCKALSGAILLQDDKSNQIKIDTLRNFYKRASIDDKIEYVVEELEKYTVKSTCGNMFDDDNWALYQEDLLNKDILLEKRLQFVGKIRTTPEDKRINLIKDAIWSELQEKIVSPELSIMQKIELFNQIAKAEVLDSDKSKYFEILLGKDGQGGLLDEISKSPEKSFEVYKKLLDKDSRIPDPKVRSMVIKLAVQQFIEENGYYNDIKASEQERDDFVLQVKKLKKQLKSEFSMVDEHEILRCLADQTFSQQKLSGAIKPDPAEIDINDQNVIKAAYGLDGLTYLFEREVIDRNVVVEYMLSEGKKEDVNKIMDIIAKAKESSTDNIDWKGVNQSLFINAKKEFDQAPLPVQACIMTYLAQGSDWNNQFKVVADKLFYQTGELGETSKKFLKSYISSRPESERYFYLSAMYSASQNKSNFTDNIKDSKYTKEERSVAEGLRLFLENSGPAGVKLAQAMSSYSGVPDFIKDEMQKAKNNANPPARWEVFDWLEQTQQTKVLEKVKIGKLLGSASFFVTYDMIDDNGEDKVIKINRLGSANKAETEFEIYKSTLDKLKDDFPQILTFKRLIDNAAQMVKVETNLEIGEQQLRDAQRLYPKNCRADKVEFAIQVMDWNDRGKTWAVMEKAQGKDFNDLAQPYKKAAAKAVFVTELANMLSGKRFDSDRHSGQYKFDTETNTIGVFDTGSISIVEPSEKEKYVLGAVLAQTVQKLVADSKNTPASIFCAEIDKGIAHFYAKEIKEDKPIPPYLSEFQRGLLALTDFHKEIPPKELAICVMRAINNGKHKLDPIIHNGFKETTCAASGNDLVINFGAIEKVADYMATAADSDLMTPEAKMAQNLGRLVVAKVFEEQNIYGVLTEEIKSETVVEILSSPEGQIHFAKGVAKAVFDKINPKNYDSAQKQQVGQLLYQVVAEGIRQKKLHHKVSLAEVFEQKAKQMPELGDYAKEILAVNRLADKFGVIADGKMFKKAVVLGRLIDKDVQKGYVMALRETPENSFIRKALSYVSPLSFIPEKSSHEFLNFVMKKVAPKCAKMITELEKISLKNVEKEHR